MKTVPVNASGSYEVRIGTGLLAQAGEQIRQTLPKAETAAIVTDDTVDALYGAALEKSLAAAQLKTVKIVLPHGEASKNGESYLRILGFLAEAHLTRSDMLVALGGGMAGDIGAFSAATYLRGISYVQIPTTLLADVDSSVGGKTAIDLDAGKNLAGAFCQPALVLCDPDTLRTLPEDIFTDGCAEVVKYGILRDEDLFSHLEERGRDFDREYVLETCISIKRDYVEADEFDTGPRRQLNLGHTLGHAVEAAGDFSLSHGKAVAIGTAVVARASVKAGYCDTESAARIVSILERFGLPTRTELDMDTLYKHMLSDKKRLGGTVNVIVPETIGRCRVQPMQLDQARAFFEAGL